MSVLFTFYIKQKIFIYHITRYNKVCDREQSIYNIIFIQLFSFIFRYRYIISTSAYIQSAQRFRYFLISSYSSVNTFLTCTFFLTSGLFDLAIAFLPTFQNDLLSFSYCLFSCFSLFIYLSFSCFYFMILVRSSFLICCQTLFTQT